MTPPRLLTLATPLGPGALVPTWLAVRERVGEPYRVEVVAAGADVELLPAKLLTQAITVTVAQPLEGKPLVRHFHGLVAEFERLEPTAGGMMAYRLVAVPGIWRLSLRRHCRIFQGKTVKDIVEAVLAEHDQPAPQWGMLPAIEPLPYCTQYNETDLDFVSRLLEEHGLSYYHKHASGSHTLCISATAQGFPAFDGGDLAAVHGSTRVDELAAWSRANRARSALVELVDMDGERSQPSVTLAKRSETRAYAGEPAMWKAGKVHRWPGGMATRPGVDSAAVAMGAIEAASEHYVASSRDPRLAAGVRVGIAVRSDSGAGATQQYVVTGVEHEARDLSTLVAGAGETEHYAATLQLVSAARAWVPEARHARPVMAGLYSATVTGPKGEQIHVDEFGRIKLRFRWDTAGVADDASSCWVRVAQAAAGAWGGTWFLPRVGDEVLVAFLDGDPDRPVVTGSVYGKDAKPPFQPGSNRAQSGISTRSYKSDSSADANVLRFEDKKGDEDVLLHAQKNLTVEVENDERRSVGHDQTVTVKNARTVTVKDADDKLTLEKGHRTTTIEKGNDSLDIDTGNRSTTLKQGNDTLTLNMGNEEHVLKMGDLTVK